jgi:hypothetical protein
MFTPALPLDPAFLDPDGGEATVAAHDPERPYLHNPLENASLWDRHPCAVVL